MLGYPGHHIGCCATGAEESRQLFNMKKMCNPSRIGHRARDKEPCVKLRQSVPITKFVTSSPLAIRMWRPNLRQLRI